MRKTFAEQLYKHMQANKDIWLVVGDLGFGLFDQIRDDFPDRFLNTGAAETAMMNIAVGLALEGKIPFVYSITPFLLYRPFEVIRTYINHDRINVKLIGSGRDQDYHIDGFSHDASDIYGFLDQFENIQQYIPQSKEVIPAQVKRMLELNQPCFLSLQR